MAKDAVDKAVEVGNTHVYFIGVLFNANLMHAVACTCTYSNHSRMCYVMHAQTDRDTM